MFNLVKKLIPKIGFLWRAYDEHLNNLLYALNEEPKRLQEFIHTIVRESNPGTAIDTQEEWYQQYDLKYNPTKSTTEKQAETLERYIALGDQDIVYVQDQVYKAGFTDVTILENSPPSGENSNECGIGECGVAECWNGSDIGEYWIFHYFVIGTVGNDEELTRLKGLLQKIAPGHLVPVYSIISSENECGPAECGVAICEGIGG